MLHVYIHGLIKALCGFPPKNYKVGMSGASTTTNPGRAGTLDVILVAFSTVSGDEIRHNFRHIIHKNQCVNDFVVEVYSGSSYGDGYCDIVYFSGGRGGVRYIS